MLYTFDLETRAPKASYSMPTAGAFCNDIAIGADGTAYASDSANMEIVRLQRGAKRLEVWAGNGTFSPKGGVLDGVSLVGERVLVISSRTSACALGAPLRCCNLQHHRACAPHT